MKNIKNFTSFFESNDPENIDYGNIYAIVIDADETYGYMTINSKTVADIIEGTEPNEHMKDPDYDTREQIFEIGLDAPHGIINGNDCWSSIDYAMEDEEEDEEEIIDSVDSWLADFGLGNYDAERLFRSFKGKESDDYYNSVKNEYIKGSKKIFDDQYKFEDIYNFIVITEAPVSQIHIDGDPVTDFNYDINRAFSPQDYGNPIILAYKGNDDNLYLLDNEGNLIKSGADKNIIPPIYNSPLEIIKKIIEPGDRITINSLGWIASGMKGRNLNIRRFIEDELIRTGMGKDAQGIKGKSLLRRFGAE